MNFKTLGVKLDSEHTDIVIANYSNNLLIVISQIKKFGSIVKVEKEVLEVLLGQENVFHTKSLFGVENQQEHLLARNLAEKLNVAKPVIFVLSLKNYTPRITKALEQILKEHKQW